MTTVLQGGYYLLFGQLKVSIGQGYISLLSQTASNGRSDVLQGNGVDDFCRLVHECSSFRGWSRYKKSPTGWGANGAGNYCKKILWVDCRLRVFFRNICLFRYIR
ncbi:hypothetical protein JZU71_00515, partial [bacterium]|nr:hypothetical protein [bacterium]